MAVASTTGDPLELVLMAGDTLELVLTAVWMVATAKSSASTLGREYQNEMQVEPKTMCW